MQITYLNDRRIQACNSFLSTYWSLSKSIFVSKILKRRFASAGSKWSNSSASLILPKINTHGKTKQQELSKDKSHLILQAFENRIPKWIFGFKKDENRKWRRLNNEELHSWHHSPNTVKVIKSRRLRWAGPVARM